MWVSKDKHANYPSKTDCKRFLSLDSCVGNVVNSSVFVHAGRNVGTYHHTLKDCVSSEGGEPGLECYWDRAWSTFAGWQGTGGDTPYWEILRAFEYSP